MPSSLRRSSTIAMGEDLIKAVMSTPSAPTSPSGTRNSKVSDMLYLAGSHFHEALSEVADEVSFGRGFIDMNRRGRHSHWGFDFFPGTVTGQFASLMMIACVMVCCFTWVWASVGGDIALEGGDDYERQQWKWRVSAWHAWSLFIDPGTQTGILGTAKTLVKCMGAIISIFGFIFNLTVLGFIVDFMQTTLERLQQLYGRDVCNDHILVLGWTDKTIFLLTELMTLLADEDRLNRENDSALSSLYRRCLKPRPTIVVLGSQREFKMIADAKMALPKFNDGTVRIRFREGRPHEIKDLNKVSVLSARVVVILGASPDPSVSDCLVTSSVLAVQAIASEVNNHFKVNNHAPVICEMRLPESVAVIEALGGDTVYGVSPVAIVCNIIAMCALSPPVGRMLAELVSFQSDCDLQLSKLSPRSIKEWTFGGIRRSHEFHDKIVLAVIPSSQNRLSHDIHFAPDDSYEVDKDSVLLVIARSNSTVDLDYVEDPEKRDTSDTKLQEKDIASMDFEHVSGKPQKMILLGWRTNSTTRLIKALDDRLNKNSTVHVLSELPVDKRELDLDESGFHPTRIAVHHYVGEIDRETSIKKMIDKASDGHISSITGILIAHDSEATILDSRENAQASAFSQIADAHVLSASVVVSHLCRRNTLAEENGKKNGLDYARKIGLIGSSGVAPPLACQFLDNLMQRILQKQPHILKQMDSLVPVHRNALETGVLTLAASNPKMVNLLSRLLVKHDAAKHAPCPFVAENAVDYLTYPYTASFDELDEKLRASGRVLIGWTRIGSSWNELNPKNRQNQLKWQDGDMLLAAIDPKLMGAAMNAAELLIQKVRAARRKTRSRATVIQRTKTAPTDGGVLLEQGQIEDIEDN